MICKIMLFLSNTIASRWGKRNCPPFISALYPPAGSSAVVTKIMSALCKVKVYIFSKLPYYGNFFCIFAPSKIAHHDH